jgi:hypothetical protein
MKKIDYTLLLLSVISVSSLNALSSEIENFDHYVDTSELQSDVSSFGTAAQAGRPTLSFGTGESGTNAAKFALTWEAGNNANLIFYNVSAVSGNLSNYEKVEIFFNMEVPNGFNPPANPTIVKLAIEGATSNTIWQTRSAKAVQLTTDISEAVTFELTDVDMERVSGSESFLDVLTNAGNIRLRFENSMQAGVMQFAHIDSINAITELPKSGTIIQIGLSNMHNDFEGI